MFYVSNKSGLWSRINKQWSGNNVIHKDRSLQVLQNIH